MVDGGYPWDYPATVSDGDREADQMLNRMFPVVSGRAQFLGWSAAGHEPAAHRLRQGPGGYSVSA
jgi:hypothetical protein